MGRHRSRSYSRSRSPPRRKRYDDGRSRRSPEPSGLLVRNISLIARPEDLRVHFERFGPIKDIYLPKNYYTGEPRGFGFVKFRYPEDAAEAKSHLNRTVLGGREIRIVYAEENRKTPHEIRRIMRVSSSGSHRRRSPSVSPRRRYHSRSRSPARHASRERGRGTSNRYSPRKSRSISRSASPRDERRYMSRERSPRPRDKSRNRSRSLSHSVSPSDHSRPNHRSPSPMRRNTSISPARSRSKSYSPH